MTSEAARIGLIGEGDGLERRRTLLEAAGIAPLYLTPDANLGSLSVLFVAGLAAAPAQVLAQRARRAGVLVNVEDIPELSDFHVPAILRRGDLMFSVSTHGRSPGLARRLREWLEARFGSEWEQHSAELGGLRERWRREGVPMDEISARTGRIIEEKGWLS